jgi:hypothetical protein
MNRLCGCIKHNTRVRTRRKFRIQLPPFWILNREDEVVRAPGEIARLGRLVLLLAVGFLVLPLELVFSTAPAARLLHEARSTI